MIFIFDWGYQTVNNIGPLSREDAIFEIQSEFVWLQESISWFRLFFIPLIPTDRTYYFSGVESADKQLITKEEFIRLKPLAALNKKAMNDELSPDDYNKQRSEL